MDLEELRLAADTAQQAYKEAMTAALWHEYGDQYWTELHLLRTAMLAACSAYVDAHQAARPPGACFSNPRVVPMPRELPRRKPRRGEVTRWRRMLRPARPTMRMPKDDPRRFWYSYETIKFFEWLKEVAAREKRGEKHPHLRRRWITDISHRMYDLNLLAERSSDIGQPQAGERRAAA
jgi:hypothetical protein